MRKRFQIALVVFLVGVLGVVAWPILSEHEPVYHGKRLSTWLASDDGSMEAELNAQRAVMQAGTNAVPILLRMLRQRDSPLKGKVLDLAQSQPIIRVYCPRAESRNAGAWVGFSTLGVNAASAVPALMEICDLKISAPSQCYAVRSLAAIGPAAKSATPTLLRATTNSDIIVRAESLHALVCIQAEPDLAVSALTQALSDSNSTVRFVACNSLAQLGEAAEHAVPSLVKALKDPVRDVGERAAVALWSIDPKVATKAGEPGLLLDVSGIRLFPE